MEFTGERLVPDSEFCAPHTDLFKEHAARYQFASEYIIGKKVLDMACGTGYGSKILADAGASEVFGCDISEKAILHAKDHYAEGQTKFLIMDSRNLLFPNESFDCIVSFETLEHVDNFDMMISEFHRVLKPNGIMIISTPNADRQHRPPNEFHVHEFTKDEFLSLLNPSFDVTLYSQRLQIQQSFLRRLSRNIVLRLIRLDFLNLRLKQSTSRIYSIVNRTISNVQVQYAPIPYRDGQIPIVFMAVCRKKVT